MVVVELQNDIEWAVMQDFMYINRFSKFIVQRKYDITLCLMDQIIFVST